MLKKLRLGMIGGGLDSMIGSIHRHAAYLDNHYDLVAGVFSTSFEKSKLLASQLGLDESRIYTSYQEMLETEVDYPQRDRIEVISIVTPNDLHFEIARSALFAGLHVIIDKPLAQTLSEANELAEIMKKCNKSVCITYVYTGYPMIKEARSIIKEGKLGSIRKVIVEFSQGWLSTSMEMWNKQAMWRMDPKRNTSGTIADIGTHAFHLAEYVTGLSVTHVCADLHSAVANRFLEDDGVILLKFNQDVPGILIASQIAAGEEANLSLRIYGEKGSIHWQHTDSNSLLIKWLNQPMQVMRAGNDNHYLHTITLHNCRTPAGHSEGFIEAFTNHYRNFALCINANKNNDTIKPEWHDYPKIEDGIRGVLFVEKVLASHQTKEKWLAL